MWLGTCIGGDEGVAESRASHALRAVTLRPWGERDAQGMLQVVKTVPAATEPQLYLYTGIKVCAVGADACTAAAMLRRLS
jgi:hypothetical protein